MCSPNLGCSCVRFDIERNRLARVAAHAEKIPRVEFPCAEILTAFVRSNNSGSIYTRARIFAVSNASIRRCIQGGPHVPFEGFLLFSTSAVSRSNRIHVPQL